MEELTSVIDDVKKSLMRNEADKEKQRNELKQIETEQKAQAPNNFIIVMKAQCVKCFGEELYNKIYSYLMKAKTTNIDFNIMQRDINTMVGKDKDKMNMVFFIDQLVDKEMSNRIYI